MDVLIEVCRVVRTAIIGAMLCLSPTAFGQTTSDGPPNVIIVLADQWRAQAVGYAGDPNLVGKTPNLDAFEKESINFVNAVSGSPVCSPYRASLLTGQYPLTHGLFLNDLTLPRDAETIAKVWKSQGYATGYIGKWHLDGQGRRQFTPPERRQGFDYWKALECSHDYNNSYYYAEADPAPQKWEDYDALAQTRDAQQFIESRAKDDAPFALMLSWGPPHNPYQSAPQEFRDAIDRDSIVLRPNVTDPKYRADLHGYYAHIAALDWCMGELLKTLEDAGVAEDTIVLFTSDHGDMIGSHDMERKQKPWDESIRVPFLLRYPGAHGASGKRILEPINSPDIMPTLLGLLGIAIPDSVEGRDFAGVVRGDVEPQDSATLIMCIAPFGEWIRDRGGREFRGVRTARYTYARSLDGPWLLYDNESDPYQMQNLIGDSEYADIQGKLESQLQGLLTERGDEFLHADEYIARWEYTVNENGTVGYSNDLPAHD